MFRPALRQSAGLRFAQFALQASVEATVIYRGFAFQPDIQRGGRRVHWHRHPSLMLNPMCLFFIRLG